MKPNRGINNRVREDEVKMRNEIDCAFEDTATASDYERLALRIKADRGYLGEALYDIGLALNEAKKSLAHGTFLRFLRDERVNYGLRAAQTLMKIARAEDGRALAELGVAKATQMLRLGREQRDDLFRNNKLSSFTVSQIRKLIDDVLGKKTSFRAAREIDRSGYQFPTKVAWAAGVLHVPIQDLCPASIQAAFRELAQVFHPDKGFAPDAKFLRGIVEARETLLRHTASSQAA